MKKKILLLAAVLTAAFMSMTGYADVTGTVSTAMNFRSEPSYAGTLIGSVPQGSTVTVLGSSNGWDYVMYGGSYGWIHSGNVVSGAGAVSNVPQTYNSAYNQTYNTTYNTGSTYNTAASSNTGSQTAYLLYGMNFRTAPGMYGAIMTAIPAGTQVQYLGSSNGWDQVVYNGTVGWIAGGRLSYAQQQTTVTAPAAAAAATTASAAATTGGTVNRTVSNGMNFRAAPGMDGAIQGAIPAGSAVEYLSTQNGWDRVIYQGHTGWIKSGNLY